MRNIIIVSGVAELLLLVGAILAGAPVVALLRTAISRSANALLLAALGVTWWVAAGILINRAVLYLPANGQFVTGPLRIGDTDFNLTVFVPMILISLTIAYLSGRSVIAAYSGRSLQDCIGLRPSLTRRQRSRTT
jgi:hypothetical protein